MIFRDPRNRHRHHLSATLLDGRAGNGWARLLRCGRDRSDGGFPNAGYEPASVMRRLSLNRSEPAKKSGQNIPKNRCRTTIAERMGETPAELPFIRDQVSRPAESHRRALAGRVEDWRAGLGRCRATFPAPATSNAACGFPALRSPICFTSRLIGPILPGRLSACRVALDSR